MTESSRRAGPLQAPNRLSGGKKRLLVTAGPTQEPIDAVRYIGNRSSGRMGVALADAGASLGWETRLLLGPTRIEPSDPQVAVERFRTTSDLDALLDKHLPDCDILIMAAAVADFRPVVGAEELSGKNRRTESGLALRLEATPDLLAGCVRQRRAGQLIVGFALEPRDRLVSSARAKLERKGVDLVVANPLETMDSADIEAVVLGRPGTGLEAGRSTDGKISKPAFAAWLIRLIEEQADAVAR